MPIITLTTDLGDKDHYVGALKGRLLSLAPDVSLIDITHHVTPHHVQHAAYVLGECWHEFPIGTVHLVGIDYAQDVRDRMLIHLHEGHYFVGFDNGWFSLIAQARPEAIWMIQPPEEVAATFLLRDVMGPVAAALANGVAPHTLGLPINHTKELYVQQAVVTPGSMRAHIIHVDRFGNLITNISRQEFEQAVGHHRFYIGFRREQINKLSLSYQDVPEGEKLAFFNSNDRLEIAINQGSASQLLGLQRGDIIQIDILHDPDR